MLTSIQPGSVIITELAITNHAGTKFNLLGQCIYFSFQESILDSVIMGELAIVDGIDLLSIFPIVGGEKVSIQYNTPGLIPRTLTLLVNSVVDVMSADDQTTKTYMINCVSEEAFYGVTEEIEQVFVNSYDQIIKSILSDYLHTTKKFIFEATSGIHKAIFNRKRPFDAISYLQKKSVSTLNSSASFVFFENKEGFNFNTIENLLRTNQKLAKNKIITKVETVQDSYNSASTFNNLKQYTVGQHFNIMELMNKGAFSTEHEEFDLITKKITKSSFDINDYKKYSNIDTKSVFHMVHGKVISKYLSSNKKSTRTFRISDSSQLDSDFDQALVNKMGFLSMQFNRATDVSIDGDSEISAGYVIEINIPKITGIHNDRQMLQEQFINGNYLIGAVTHKFDLHNESGATYSQMLKLIKGTYLIK